MYRENQKRIFSMYRESWKAGYIEQTSTFKKLTVYES